MNNSLVETVFQEMSSSLLGYLRTLLQDQTLAEDVFQNVFRKLWQTKTPQQEIRNLKSFVFTIARNEARRELSKVKSHISLNKEDGTIFEIFEPGKISPLESLCLEESLLKIPAEQREIIYLKTYGALTFQEIADTLEITINTVTSRYRYGLEKMRKFLGEQND